MLNIIEKKKYPKEVEEIHREFETAGDRLLAEAKSILKRADERSINKAEKLIKHGFINAKGVKENQKAKENLSVSGELAQCVEYFQHHYPQNKFITLEQVETICNKYKLLHGPTDKFVGFIPEKNIDDITNFRLRNEDRLTMFYIKSINFNHYINEKDKKKILKHIDDVERFVDLKSSYSSYTDFKTYIQNVGFEYSAYSRIDGMTGEHTERNKLSICAPKKDFNLEGMEIKRNSLISKIVDKLEVKITPPDPVVLQSVFYKRRNNTYIKGFLIVTAWGDEASDPIIVNENHN